MGDGRWEMGDGRWEMGDGRLQVPDSIFQILRFSDSQILRFQIRFLNIKKAPPIRGAFSLGFLQLPISGQAPA